MVVKIQRPYPPVVSYTENEGMNLTLESTLQQLPLYRFQVELSQLGQEVKRTLEANPLLPGAILTDKDKFVGMISRRRFLEHLSRPYGLELFLKRPIHTLHRLAENQLQVLMFPGNTLIVDAARRSLQRSPEYLYEPIVVQLSETEYRLLDIHRLLVAQSHIHELTTQLLKENTQSQLIQTEKMASLGQMVAGVAHEIRNPVNCILGNLQFLANYSQDLLVLIEAYQKVFSTPNPEIEQLKEEMEFDFLREDFPQIISSMQVGADRLSKLVSGLRNFSHMNESNPQPADLHECIESTLLILNNRLKQGIHLIKNYGELPLISCYSGQLSQVFMNLLSNAIDALVEQPPQAGEQPRIEITTTLVEESPASLVSIRIADNGSGIPTDIQSRIFETFFTTKPVGQGTGLGLAISHQIITQKHQGQIRVRSPYLQSGKGTEFEILLPAT